MSRELLLHFVYMFLWVNGISGFTNEVTCGTPNGKNKLPTVTVSGCLGTYLNSEWIITLKRCVSMVANKLIYVHSFESPVKVQPEFACHVDNTPFMLIKIKRLAGITPFCYPYGKFYEEHIEEARRFYLYYVQSNMKTTLLEIQGFNNSDSIISFSLKKTSYRPFKKNSGGLFVSVLRNRPTQMGFIVNEDCDRQWCHLTSTDFFYYGYLITKVVDENGKYCRIYFDCNEVGLCKVRDESAEGKSIPDGINSNPETMFPKKRGRLPDHELPDKRSLLRDDAPFIIAGTSVYNLSVGRSVAHNNSFVYMWVPAANVTLFRLSIEEEMRRSQERGTWRETWIMGLVFMSFSLIAVSMLSRFYLAKELKKYREEIYTWEITHSS